MSSWDKLLKKLYSLSSELKYSDLKKILERYGFTARETRGGSSHVTFYKKGCAPITIPRHKEIKKIYIRMVRDAVIKEEMKK